MKSHQPPPSSSPTMASPSPTSPSFPSKPSIIPNNINNNDNVLITETPTLTFTPPPPPSKPRTKTKRKPNNTRRPRKRSDEGIVIREEEEKEDDGDDRRPRKRKQHPSKQPMSSNGEDKSPLVASIPSSNPVMDYGDDGCRSGESNVWDVISELVMWKDVAKSALWFGSGSILFMSSYFSQGSNFSMISASSHLGILMLGMAFFNDCLPKREQQNPTDGKFQVTEDDFLRAARVILPMTNAVLAKCQKIFSGEPSVTLKVAPVLFLTSKYGHLITPWRLLATGFFLSFTLPKLYCSYSEKIHQQVEEVNSYIKQAWKSCPRKKFFATSTAMILWNMCSVKMRMFAAFMSVVLLRHQHQQHRGSVSGETEGREGEQHQEMMVGD